MIRWLRLLVVTFTSSLGNFDIYRVANFLGDILTLLISHLCYKLEINTKINKISNIFIPENSFLVVLSNTFDWAPLHKLLQELSNTSPWVLDDTFAVARSSTSLLVLPSKSLLELDDIWEPSYPDTWSRPNRNRLGPLHNQEHQFDDTLPEWTGTSCTMLRYQELQQYDQMLLFWISLPILNLKFHLPSRQNRSQLSLPSIPTVLAWADSQICPTFRPLLC